MITSPVISGLPAVIAAAKIEEIYEVVNIHKQQLSSFGLSRGYLGVSVFTYLYAVHSGRSRYLDEARQAFDRACDMIDGDPQKAYPQDFADLGMVSQYLCQAGVLDLDPNVFLGDVDEILLKKMRTELYAGNLGGFTNGALGYGLYFLQRSYYNRKVAQSIVEELVQGIVRNAIQTTQGCYWASGSDQNDENASLFFPQGSNAILLFLVRAIEMGLVPASVLEATAREAISYIEAQRAKEEKLPAASVGNGCKGLQIPYYNNVDTGYMLLRAGAAFGNAMWSAEGRDILKACAMRHQEHVNCKQDASMRYGAAGLGVIFDRIGQVTNDPELANAASYWYTQILRFDLHTDGYAGYKAANSARDAQNNLAFSRGVIGIGCALVKALHPGKVNFNDMIWLL
nr:lanthionine synthetase LanC family protein [uncultured Dyadobacter sp.]